MDQSMKQKQRIKWRRYCYIFRVTGGAIPANLGQVAGYATTDELALGETATKTDDSFSL